MHEPGTTIPAGPPGPLRDPAPPAPRPRRRGGAPPGDALANAVRSAHARCSSDARRDCGDRPFEIERSNGPSPTFVALHFSLVAISKRDERNGLDLELDRLEGVLRRICLAEEAEILRLDLCSSHVHLLLRLPPRRSVRQVLSRLRRALSRRLLREYRSHAEDYWALHFWEWEHTAWGDTDHDESTTTFLE